MTKNLRPEASNILINMLQPTPVTRINTQDLIKHPYFSKFQLEWNRPKRFESNYEHPRRISINSKNQNVQNSLNLPQTIQQTQRLNHINSQPFLNHGRSFSEKDTLVIRQVSLSKNNKPDMLQVSNEKPPPSKHFRT